MIDHRTSQPLSPDKVLASLRGTVHRLGQSENPESVLFIKHVLLNRIADLEAETRQEPQAASSIRVMVVEDLDGFRRFVCAKLKQRPELWVVCEVSDGLEAVQKAVELRPHLILLDIGLPTLNGIQAARRILALVPESKIIFSTQETSLDIVQEAMGLGAWGYVFKSHAESHLSLAIDAVLSGKRFVSSA